MYFTRKATLTFIRKRKLKIYILFLLHCFSFLSLSLSLQFSANQAAVNELVSKGATAAASADDAAKNVEVVITMLPNSEIVSAVYTGGGSSSSSSSATAGVIKTASPNTLLIDCSTIDPMVTKSLADVASKAKKGLVMVDAPVSGGVGGAEAGTLTFMVGVNNNNNEGDLFNTRVSPLLKDMGKNIVHTGGAGTGQIAKICNNLVLGVSMSVVSEAMNLGMKMGADPKVLASIINTSSGRCWSSDTYNPVPGVMPNVPSSRGYTGGFAVPLMTKDLGLAVHAAKQLNVVLPTGSKAHAVYSKMMTSGWAGKDFSSMFEYLNTLKTPPKDL